MTAQTENLIRGCQLQLRQYRHKTRVFLTDWARTCVYPIKQHFVKRRWVKGTRRTQQRLIECFHRLGYLRLKQFVLRECLCGSEGEFSCVCFNPAGKVGHYFYSVLGVIAPVSSK